MEFKGTKEELIEIIKKYNPSIDNECYFSKYGRFVGGFEDDFVWITSLLNKEDTSTLIQILNKLKNQYK